MVIELLQEALDDRTLLMLVVRKGGTELVRKMISLNADINQAVDGQTPLMLAAKKGHFDITRLLLQHNAKKPDTELFLLYIRSRHCRPLEIISFFELLKPNDPVNLRDDQGRTLLDLAIERALHVFLAYLLKQYTWPQTIIDQTLMNCSLVDGQEVYHAMANCLELLKPGCVTRKMKRKRTEGTSLETLTPIFVFHTE